MRIQHNIGAMNANRNLSLNHSKLSKNLEKLSSGYRINRSADDAAGLAISEKMRADLAALEQAENNIQDGIALVQTADGAMQEIHDMLDRMTALAAQASNGTLSHEEREQIQAEVDALLEEITRIKDTTEFSGIPLLQGNNVVTTKAPEILGGLPTWVTSASNTTQANHLAGTYDTKEAYTITTTTTVGSSVTVTTTNGTSVVQHAAAYLDFSALTTSNVSDLLGKNQGFYTTCCTCNNHYSIKFTSGSGTSHITSGTHHIYTVGISGVTTGKELVDRILTATNSNPNSHFTKLAASGANKDILVIYDDRYLSGTTFKPTLASGSTVKESIDYPQWSYEGSSAKPSPSSSRGLFGEGVAYDASTLSTGSDVVLQIGATAEAADRLKIDLPNMGLSKIGINGLSVMTEQTAMDAISAIKAGIEYVNQERGRMGAYQNRLEHAFNANSNTRENLAAAESQIRDTDVSKEMMSYTKNNILAQSAQAMLAQANQTPQGVLQLLR